MSAADRKIIFAGLARDVAPYLPGVLRNMESLGGEFADWAVLIAENDSRDQSRALLRTWMARQMGRNARLVEMDGLAVRHPERTDRIAVARNRILAEIGGDAELRGFDYLAVLDMDAPNSYPGLPRNFRKAVDFLETHDDVAGAFPNQMPLYYDIWALREKNWCPGDCWEEVARAEPALGAVGRYVHARQVTMDPAGPPLEVDLAFGGFGLYRLHSVLGKSYAGLTQAGAPVCEHVAFHKSLRDAGGRLFILPDFLNVTSFEHTRLPDSHVMLPMGQILLLAAKEGRFTAARARAPNHGEIFARLAARGGGAVLDLDAAEGGHLALARLAGCNAPYVCVAGDAMDFAVLSCNALMYQALFGDCRLLRSLDLRDYPGAGLIRLDAATLLAHADYLRQTQPVLWLRVEAGDNWDLVRTALAHPQAMVFDEKGAVVMDGGLAQLRELKPGPGGLDIALFTAASLRAALR